MLLRVAPSVARIDKPRTRDAGKRLKNRSHRALRRERKFLVVHEKTPEHATVDKPLRNARGKPDGRFQQGLFTQAPRTRVQHEHDARAAFRLEFLREGFTVAGKSPVVQIAQGISLAVFAHARKIEPAGERRHE